MNRLGIILTPLIVLASSQICSGSHFNKNALSILDKNSQITNSAIIKKSVITKNADVYQDQWQQTLDTLKALLVKLENTNKPYTVKNVLEPLNNFEILLKDAYSESHLMESVHPDKAVRRVAANYGIEFSKIKTLLDLSRPIYEAVNQVDLDQTDSVTHRYHFLKMRDFRLSGVDKDNATRQKIKQLRKEITKIGQEFSRNIQEDVRSITVTPEELVGLPEDFIRSHEINTSGKVTITTHYPDLFPVLTFAENENVRQRLYIAWKSRAYPINKDVLRNLLEKRHELALLLGYRNYAELAMADKMIGNPENAANFIDKLYALVKPEAEKEIAELLSKLREIDPDAKQVNLWQMRYLKEKVRRDKYKLDAKEVRKYFSYNNVKNGIFQLAYDLFGVEIQPWITEVWHPSVETYKMLQDDKLVGLFYLDMHPRKGKYQHAAGFTTQIGIADRQPPIYTLVCNISCENDPGALMQYKQVKTFFHEFGHLIHELFASHHHWARISGIQTEWDFVEAPSKMFEEWIWDLDTLQTFAINDLGEPIPAELVKKINQAKMFGKGVSTIGQLHLAALSLNYYLEDPSNFDIIKKMLQIESKYSIFPHLENTYFFANFNHLNNYSAIYYTYKWSQVIADEMLSEFKKYGMRNKDTASRYCDTVLSKGGIKPANELIKDFLGHTYSTDTFTKNLDNEIVMEIDTGKRFEALEENKLN